MLTLHKMSQIYDVARNLNIDLRILPLPYHSGFNRIAVTQKLCSLVEQPKRSRCQNWADVIQARADNSCDAGSG